MGKETDILSKIKVVDLKNRPFYSNIIKSSSETGKDNSRQEMQTFFLDNMLMMRKHMNLAIKMCKDQKIIA